VDDDEIEHELGHSAKDQRDRARRKLCRKVCATLIHGMGVTDSDFTLMAIRIGKSEAGLREAVARLMDGQSISLNLLSDLFFSMGLELTFGLEKFLIEVAQQGEKEPTTDQS
jgi:hypothetical protein